MCDVSLRDKMPRVKLRENGDSTSDVVKRNRSGDRLDMCYTERW